jgi:NAD(P)-dependent dehydrogenase (short-subunit alcohol dehydrogenase family)
MKVPFNINLSGKTAIVTGGSGTLCSAMAYGLAVCGAKVAIIGRNKEKLASVSEKLTKDALDEYNKNVTVKGYSCNVINKDELTAAYETIKNELGSCAILNLTQWLAVHFGESGIRCNAIAPGFYAAEQNHDLLFNADGSYTDRARKIIAGTPMGRFGNPEDLIGAALFLASDETASFVNGIVLPVDGGYSAYSGV